MATRMATTINGLQPVCECSVCRIVGGIDPDLSLDAAWAEAEAALPKGWWIVSVRRYYFGSSWRVDFGRPDDFDPSRYIENSGPEKSTPAAALRALAAKLREREDGWNVMGFEPR